MADGYKIIKALGKRGLRGFYFSYAQYRELAGIERFEDAKAKIVAWGFAEVDSAETIDGLVDALSSFQAALKEDKGCLGFMLLEPLFWILLGLASCSG